MPRSLMAVVTLCLLGSASAWAQTTREVEYSSRSVVQVHAKLRFTTMIILPEQEQILDFVCGDKEFWIVSGGDNLAYVKPAKAAAATNLNLVTASGAVYSFLLTEGGADPDLKLYVTPDDTMKVAAAGPKKFYASAQVDELRQAAEEARNEVETARKDASAAKEAAATAAEEAIKTFRASFPTQLQFPYHFRPNEKPFYVSAIYTDGQFTYIRANAPELPSLYEVRDGVPNLINFQVEHGVYVVPKVLDRGYLIIGSRRFVFTRAQ